MTGSKRTRRAFIKPCKRQIVTRGEMVYLGAALCATRRMNVIKLVNEPCKQSTVTSSFGPL